MRLSLILAAIVVMLEVQSSHAFDGPRKSTNVPQFDAAVDKALSYLHAAVEKQEPHGGEQILAAYAMIKCGIP